MKNKYILSGILLIVVAISVGFFVSNKTSEIKSTASVSYAIPNDIVSFDNAALTEDLSINLLLGHIYETLVQYDSSKNSFQPYLAESWIVSKDGLAYDFKLRKGIKFHDSSDLTAEVVVENINRIKDPKTGPVLSQFLSGVKEIKAVDDNTVRFVLAAPSASFISNISFIGIASLPAIKNGTIAERPIGTGPLVFVSSDPGKKIIFQRNDQYWGSKAVFKELDVFVIPDENARLLALRNGGIDFLPEKYMSSENREGIAKNSEFTTARIPANSLDSLYFNGKDSQLSNHNVRIALTEALDLKEIVKILGDSVIEARGPIPVSYAENPQTLKLISYNLEDAKKLYKEATIQKPIELMYLSDNPSYQKIAEYIAEQWGKIGVKTTLKKVDITTMTNNVISDKYQVALSYLGGLSPNPLFFIEYVFSSGGPYAQFLGYKNDKLEELVKELQTIADVNGREKKFAEAQQIVIDDAPSVSLYNSTYGYIYNNKKISDFKIDPFLPSKYLEKIGLR